MNFMDVNITIYLCSHVTNLMDAKLYNIIHVHYIELTW